MVDIELRKDTFGEHFFKFYETVMGEWSTIIKNSFKDTGLYPLNPNQPKYSKLMSKVRNTQPIEGVEFKVKEFDRKQQTP